jgi:hypothetical protein
MEIKLLANRSGYLEDIEEVKTEWTNQVLAALGVDLEELYSRALPEQLECLLEQYDIEIISYPGVSALRVDHESGTVAEWAGPDFLLKTDGDTGEKYYEITIEAWSFMEEEISMS